MKKLLTKTEKKIRIRLAKRLKTKVQNRIPTTPLGIKILDVILFIEKILRKT